MKFFNIIFILTIFLISKICFSNDIFNSQDYILKFNSKNINIIKEEKINNIKIKSFKSILNKVLQKSDYENINKHIDILFVNKYVLSISINDEKIVNNNYFSKVKINFNKKSLINYFIENKINFINYLPDNFLLVIYDENNIENYLLSENNKFYKFLLKSDNNIHKFKIPNLDYNDRYLFNKKDIKNNEIKNINKLSQKYKTKNIVFVRIKSHNSIYTIKTKLINEKNNYLVREFSTNYLDLDYIFENIHINTINKWKSFNKIETNIINSIECKIKINNIYQLKYVNNLLKSNLYIKKIVLNSIIFKENTYKFYFFGNLDVLRNSLEKMRLLLTNKNNNCIIKIV